MKKLLFAAVSVLAVATAVAADSTQFGVLKVPSKAATTIVAVPWLASSTGTSAVKVADLVLTSGLAADDELYAYDDGSYSGAWHLVKGSDNVLRWEPYTITGEGGSGISAGENDATLSCGQAIMLKRKTSPIEDGFCIMGKPASSFNELSLASATVSAGVTNATWSLIAPPTVADSNPNGFTWTGLAAGKDVLYVPNETTTGAVKAYTWSGEKFRDSKKNEPTIKAGMGAWFVSKDPTSGKKVTWTAPQSVQ